MEYRARLLKSTLVATGTLSFDLEIETKGFSFKPGQATTLSFAPEDPLTDNSRIFSMCTAPAELPFVSFATRLTPGSAFKQALTTAQPGRSFILGDPFGDFTLPEEGDMRTLVFLAGGIGITPFRSMIRHLHRSKDSSPKIVLMTVNRTREETPFFFEYAEWMKSGRVFWVPVLTQNGNPSPESRQEKIGETMLRIQEKTGESAQYYLAGPPAMVDNFHQMLLGQFLVSETQILEDMFFGYLPHSDQPRPNDHS